jgi:hypothetical protein
MNVLAILQARVSSTRLQRSKRRFKGDFLGFYGKYGKI